MLRAQQKLVFVLIYNRGRQKSTSLELFAIPLAPASVRIYEFYGLGVGWSTGEITHSERARDKQQFHSVGLGRS